MRLFRLSLSFIDAYAFRKRQGLTAYQKIHQSILPDMSGESLDTFSRCPECEMLTHKFEESYKGLKVGKRRYDIGGTYDGVVVVSQRFKDAYDTAGLSGLRFRSLPDDSTFYDIYPTRQVAFDVTRRLPPPRKQNFCETCQRFADVHWPDPAILSPGTIIGAKEFVRTDIEFATRDEQHPLFICGEEAMRALNSAKLRMLEFHEGVTISE
jgi:hypothetical protein